MRAVLVSKGVVVQAVELGPRWQDPNSKEHWDPPEDQEVVLSDVAGIGWTWDGSVLSAPPPNPDVPGTPERTREDSFLALPERAFLVKFLQTSTPDEVDTFVKGLTTLEQLRDVVGTLVKFLCVGAPR